MYTNGPVGSTHKLRSSKPVNCCGNCRSFFLSPYRLGDEPGECRRRAPLLDRKSNYGRGSAWPEVDATEWNPDSGALWSIGLGIPVLPVKPNDKEPFDKDKGDDPFLCGGVNIATTDRETVESWFRHNPAINYGMAMGDGRVALDCDLYKDGGHAEYLELDHPKALEMESGRGGPHIVVNVAFDAAQKKLAGVKTIDVRARGGYIVGPGSIVDGKRYRLVCDAPVAACPPEIAAHVGRRGEKAADNTTAIGELDTLNAIARATRIVAEHPGVDQGNRDNECWRVARRVKDEGLSEPECLDLVGRFNAEKVHPPLGDGDIERIVSSAYRNGQRTSTTNSRNSTHRPRPGPRPRARSRTSLDGSTIKTFQ
jgi:hypothetical protein